MEISGIGFIQSPKDEILISLKKKRIASKLDLPKPKKFKEMMDKNERIYLTIVQHSRLKTLAFGQLTHPITRLNCLKKGVNFEKRAAHRVHWKGSGSPTL